MPDGPPGPTMSLSFLLNYSNPDNTSLASAFGVSDGPPLSNIARETLPATNRDLDHVTGAVSTTGQEWSYDFDNLLSFYFVPHQQDEMTLFSSLSPLSEWESLMLDYSPVGTLSPLQNVANSLIDDLTYLKHSVVRSDRTDDHASCTEDGAWSLLTAEKLHASISEYFCRWNHHSPIIHAATFDAGTAFRPLVLAVCLTGALLSKNPLDVKAARELLDLAELLTFHHPAFLQLQQPHHDNETAEDFPALQAAFSIAQIQLRQGSVQKRVEIRQKRFVQLITAAKALKLNEASRYRSGAFYEESKFDWPTFATNEACVRLMFGIWNLEASFMVFHDQPPRLFVEEMTLPLPCSAEAYLCSDAFSCKEALIESRIDHEEIASFSQIVAYMLRGEGEEGEALSHLSGLNVLHFFVLALGKHMHRDFHVRARSKPD